MKVKATDKYEKLNVEDKGLKRIPKEGEIFEISEERFKILNGNNTFNAKFVEKVEDIEPTVEENDVDEILNPKNNKGKSKRK